MGSPYLNSNEAIILSTHNVVINTIPAEAILTSQRLFLVDARQTRLRPQDVPFTALETVTIGDTSAMDPVLSLSVVLPDETRHTLGIVFPQTPKMKRTGERDEWATKLREYSIAAQKEGGVKPAELTPPWVAGDLPEEAGGVKKAPESPDEKYINPPLAPRKPRTRPPAGNRTLIAAGLIVVLIFAIIAVVFLFAPSFIKAGSTTTPPVTIPVVTPVVTQAPATTARPSVTTMQQPELPTGVTVPATAAPQGVLPINTGVWMRIEYNGNFSASYGTSGRMKETTGSGVRMYQIPAKDQIVDAFVQKLDASGGILTASIYNDGRIAASGTTTKPLGTLEVHADLRTVAPTVTPVAANQTPTTSAG